MNHLYNHRKSVRIDKLLIGYFDLYVCCIQKQTKTKQPCISGAVGNRHLLQNLHEELRNLVLIEKGNQICH